MRESVGEPGFGPGVNADMRLGQEYDSRYASTFPETVEVAVEHPGAGIPGSLTQQARHGWCRTSCCMLFQRLVGKDLRLAYGWKLPLCVDRVAITVRGHAMAVPQPGFLSAPGRLALRDAQGPILFAHSDLSGMSLFEEASWWGYRAAMSIVPEPRR